MRKPLALLIWLRFRGWFRRLGKNLSTTRGKVFFVLGVSAFLLWSLSLAVGSMTREATDPETVRQFAPFAMLGIALVMVVFSGSKVITFTPAELNFLFSAPFSRRQLLLYKICSSALSSLILALVLSMWQSHRSPTWAGCFAGTFLVLVFAQVTAVTVTMLRRAVVDSRTALLLRAGVIIAVLLVIIGLVDMFAPMVRDRVLFTQQAFAYARQSPLGWVVLAPFDLLTLVFATEHLWPDLFIWAGASLIMISLVVLAAMQLDQYFTETSLIASHKRQARMSRVRAGGVFAHHSSGPAKASLPSLPRLGGAGPIAWRQFTNAMRNSRGMVFFLGIMTLATAPIIYGIEEFGGDQGGDQLAVMISSMVIPWVLLILPGMLRFDFRAEIDHMDVLKSLPISPLAMTAGQVLVPTLVMIAVIGVLMVVLAILLESMRTGLLIALPFVVPVSALLIAIENALFLLSPTRAQSTPGDVQFVGRQMTRVFSKLGLLAAALGMAALVGGTVYATAALVWDSTTIPYVLAGSAAWGTLALATYLVIKLGAMLYARFDPGLHTPA